MGSDVVLGFHVLRVSPHCVHFHLDVNMSLVTLYLPRSGRTIFRNLCEQLAQARTHSKATQYWRKTIIDQISIAPVCRRLSELAHTLVGKLVPLQPGGHGLKP